MQNVLRFFLFLLFVATLRASPPAGYTEVFSSEFNGYLSFNVGGDWSLSKTAKWICHTPSAADFGAAYFTGLTEKNSLGQSINPFEILPTGSLQIKAWQDAGTSNHWRSGMISSLDINGNGFSQTLGYFEARILMPVGVGVWPSFWLESTNVIQRSKRTDPAGEIDVMEAYGSELPAKYHSNLHVWTPNGHDLEKTGNGKTITANVAGLHVFGCLVNADYVHFYLDGKEMFKAVTDPSMLGPMFPMVSFALQAPLDLSSPTYMKIDYVRVYAPPQ